MFSARKIALCTGSAALLILLASAMPSRALVVDDTTTLNTTPPPNGAPWANVGNGNGASGVYLKNGWVISARHVYGGASSPVINFDGVPYLGGTIFVLTNPDGTPSDVVLFNIGGGIPAGASPIGITPTTLAPGSAVTMIGYGAKRSGPRMRISYSGGTLPGYLWDNTGGATKSWGNNTRAVSSVTMVQVPGNNAFVTIVTSFTASGSSQTTQAAVGDSGGAVFSKSGSTWLLAATMNAIGGHQGQQANTAANGDATYSADLSAYAMQISPRIDSTAPAPVLDSVSPTVLTASDSPQTLTLTGSSFVNGAKVQVARSSNPSHFEDTAAAAVFVNASTVTVSVNATVADTWKLRVVNPDGRPSSALSLTIQPPASYSGWLKDYPALTGDAALETADPDGDGLSNLQEYALGSDPTAAADARVPVGGSEIVGGQNYLTLTYQKDTSKTDLTYQAQTTTDLTTGWSDLSDLIVNTTGTIEQHQASVPADVPSRFLRIKVSK